MTDKLDASELGRRLSGLRKKRVGGQTFSDRELAREAGRKGAQKRWANHAKQTQETTDPAATAETETA